MSTIIPYFMYRDGASAVTWLTEVFGFEKGLVVPLEDGKVVHAELKFGDSMIMLGTAPEAYVKQSSSDSAALQGIYVYIEEVDAHYEKAKAAGAEIVYPPKDTEIGTRNYRARDLDGYEWTFGNYTYERSGSDS